jgi:hypothetical protein
MSNNPVRPAYVIRTLYWGRYHDMYGDDWVDMESTVYRDSLCEAINYAREQSTDNKTIESVVMSTFNNEVMYRTEHSPSNQVADQSPDLGYDLILDQARDLFGDQLSNLSDDQLLDQLSHHVI